jgi:hypothetical protein
VTELNYDEAKRAAVYEELLAKRARGEYVSDHQLADAELIRDRAYRNAELRAQHQARLADDEATKQAARQAERDQVTQAAIAAFKQQAAAAFPGTAAQFEAQWPQLLADWQRAQLQAELTHNQNAAWLRASGRYQPI